MKAVLDGVTIAESDQTVYRGGNHYFPHESLRKEHFNRSDLRTICSIKGQAHYYNVAVNGDVIEDAAWYYPEPLPTARNIANHVAFYTNRGIKVVP